MNAQNSVRSSGGSILLLSPDGALFQAMAPHFHAAGLPLEGHAALDALLERWSRPAGPDAGPPPPQPAFLLMLIDLRAFPRTEVFSRLAAVGPAGGAPRPLLVGLGQPENLGQRLAVLRAGATAWLSLDLEPAALAQRVAALAAPPGGLPERVLVVDDQPVSALFAVRVLERAGLVTEQVQDPLAVLPALARFAPDLVLMDLHMPGISGLELTAAIREQERFADLPIVFLSVELDAARQLDALRVGADDFLAKPVAPERLLDCVRQRLARARHRALVRTGTARAPVRGLVDRDRLFARLDRLIHVRSGDWVLVYFELPPDAGEVVGARQLAAAVAAKAGANALVAGVGGQGAAALVRSGPGQSFPAFAEALGRCVRADLPALPDGDPPRLGVGWCPVPAGGGESVTLVSRARKAARVSLARNDGRARGYVKVQARSRPAAADPVLDAAATERFQLLFQPLLPLRAAAAARYEALPRLLTSADEVLDPAAFLPALRRAGRVAVLDRWLLGAGLDALRERRAARLPVALFLHQSFATVADDHWVDELRAAISARDLVHFRPVIQWQVAELEDHLELAARRAAQLAVLGIRLCLNGFPDGESGVRVLGAVPASYVRLAREVTDASAPERLRALVTLAHVRRARVIADGVAGPEAIGALHLAGVDLIQGSYVAPPGETMDFDFAEG